LVAVTTISVSEVISDEASELACCADSVEAEAKKAMPVHPSEQNILLNMFLPASLTAAVTVPGPKWQPEFPDMIVPQLTR
jgi:hypothetical protein